MLITYNFKNIARLNLKANNLDEEYYIDLGYAEYINAVSSFSNGDDVLISTNTYKLIVYCKVISPNDFLALKERK